MKMLAKRTEDRYQTAARLESDLRRCVIEWEARQQIDDSTEQTEANGVRVTARWGCRSAGRSSTPMAVSCGPETNEPRGAVFQFTLPAAGEGS